MPVDIEYLGWATFRFVTENGTKIVIDPFLEGDASHGIPPSVARAKELSDSQVIIVTHAAFDHSAQAIELMKTSEAVLFSPIDVGMKVLKEGVPSNRVFYMVQGVRFKTFDINIRALEASHISLSQFEGRWLTGVPLSYIIDFGVDGKIFFSGDSALGMHYRFFGEFHQPNLAILGIGGVSFQGQYLTELHPDEAAIATKWLNVKTVIPMHYLGSEATEFQQELKRYAPEVELAIMKPGERLRFTCTRGVIK